VRHPVAGAQAPKRHWETEVLRRLPFLREPLVRLFARLPPHSRLRRLLVRRAIRLSLDASNRRDDEMTFMLWADDCKSAFPPQMASLGEPGVRGRLDRIRWESKWREQWGDVHYVPDELIDCGETVVVTGRLEGSGAGSGAAVDTDWALLLQLGSEGVLAEQVFFDRTEALERIGLRKE